MADIFAKLNLRQQREILVLNAPQSFEPALRTLQGVRILRRLADAVQVGFALAFVTRQQELDQLVRMLLARAPGDPLLWFAYPKGTSKGYRCEFNRDTGFDTLREAGFDSVRIVAIDTDWSALRFRRVEFIKR